MPIYAYRCAACDGLTDHLAAVDDAPAAVTCEHCGSGDTRRVIARVAYHASEATKVAKLDSKYEKKVDDAMRKSASASEHRLIDKLKPFKKP
jgi:putative FmdB family regulatory protein